MPTTLFDNTEVAFANKSNFELKNDKLLFSLMGNNALVAMGTSLTQFAIGLHFPISPFYKYTVYKHFCGGETFDETKKTIDNLAKYNVSVLLNYGVELKETEEDFDKTISHTLAAIRFAGANKTVKVICIKLTGFGRFALYEKIQNNEPLSASEKDELQRIRNRFETLCKAAKENKVALYVDAEESWIQQAIDTLIEEMMLQYNDQYAVVYNTLQLYRWGRVEYLQECLKKAQQKNFFLGIKIVRGAYMEQERARAAEMNYPSPIHKNKKEVDEDFNAAMMFCLQHLDKISLCIASQSEESNLKALSFIAANNLPKNHPNILFSQLYGMGDNITFNLAKAGYNATKYLPYGPVKDVIPYLIRRAQENTSVAGQMGRELKLINEEIKRRKI